jgi:hypothetical protein
VPPAEHSPLQHEAFGSVRTDEQGDPPHSVGFSFEGVQQSPRFPAVAELLHVFVQHAVFVPVGLGPEQPFGAASPELTQHWVHWPTADTFPSASRQVATSPLPQHTGLPATWQGVGHAWHALSVPVQYPD